MTRLERKIRCVIQHYNPSRYWRYRDACLKYRGGGLFNKVLCFIKLFYIKRCDAFNNASLGSHISYGAKFGSIPSFPHGLYGIVVSHNAEIGKNCVIFQNVTIGEGNGGAPVIGDNCFIGANAIVIGNIKVGNNVKIGAGTVVSVDVPDNSTVVGCKCRIIEHD